MRPQEAPVKKRVMFYCQHVLGMGHLVRSLAILEKLNAFEVRFINGGEVASDIKVPSFVQVVNLPPLHDEPDFKGLRAANDSVDLDTVKEIRRRQLLDELEQFQPHALVIELFPFGRKQFASELVPILARNRLNGGPTTVICSLRDILVSKSDSTRHEERCVRFMNRYFDAVLIHSDPAFQTIDETFSRMADVRCRVQYTGFVARECTPSQPQAVETLLPEGSDIPLIVVSVGGGRVGYELVATAIQASVILYATLPHRLLVFTGPYMPNAQIECLRQLANGLPHIYVRRYATEFPAILKQADLSISMAGYNTCMDILTTRVRALVLPFAGPGNDEQTMRARKLERRGILTILEVADLEPSALAQRMAHFLRSTPSDPMVNLSFDGAQRTAILIGELLSDHAAPSPQISQVPVSIHLPLWRRKLETFLEQQLETGAKVRHLFLRDDDVDEDEESLRHLLDICASRGVPLNLEVIPDRLTKTGTQLLDTYARSLPRLFELHQHGWQHLNHEQEGKKCEFGPSRTFQEQLADIRQGKNLLGKTFQGLFFPAFTPPWNRCTKDTYRVLDELGFQVLSKDCGKERSPEHRFSEFSTTLDLYTWKTGASMKSPDKIVHELIGQLEQLPITGLLLHHKVMTAEAFLFLDQLLCELARYSMIKFHTFRTLLPLTQASQVVQR